MLSGTAPSTAPQMEPLPGRYGQHDSIRQSGHLFSSHRYREDSRLDSHRAMLFIYPTVGVRMEMEWVDRSQPSGRQAVPVVLAGLVGMCGIFLPRSDAMYGPAFVAAMVFALSTPLALLMVAPKGLLERNRAFRWLCVASVFSAICAVVTSGILMSMGSPAGAAGDIGGFPLWLASTIALVTVTGCAVKVWRLEHAGPPTTLRGLQRQERRDRRTNNR